jgi:hypothetical protein
MSYSSLDRDTKVTEDIREYPLARQITTESIFSHRVQYVIRYGGKGKGKAIPVQALTEPEGSSFKTVGT